MGLLQDFLRNVLTVILLGSIGIFLVFRFSKKWAPWVWGILFGLTAIITMKDHILVGTGRFVDFSHVVMTLAGFIGGFYPGLIAAFFASIYCLVQGGANLWDGIFTVFSFGLIGGWLRKQDLFWNKKNYHLLWLIVGLGLGVIALAIISLVPPWNISPLWVVQKAAIPVLLLTPIATWLIFKIFLFLHNLFQKASMSEVFFKNASLPSIVIDLTLNSLTEGVIATDSEGRIFLINEAALQLTGYSRIEAMDQPLTKIFYLINEQTNKPVDITAAKTSGHLILVTRDFNEIIVALHRSPIKSAEGSIMGAVTIVQDITEKRQAEQELFRTHKLESLGILAGGIAHDFNNILAAILSNIQLAQMKYKKNEDIERYLHESIESTRRASDLTRQLLTFSKGGAPVKKAASLAELICDTAQFALRGSMVKVECRIPETLCPVEVDTGQISQVIHNLVINAQQAMPRGGIIEISAANISIESACPGVPPIGAHHRFQPGNYIEIIVKDHGIGIPKENLAKIFDPYFTTKKEGSGLGLATAYSIIRRHDGFIEVESEMGMGTTFFIYLPALSPTLILAVSEKETAVTAEPFKILLMDDEEIILKSVGEMLRDNGHQVLLVTDGAMAVESYRKALECGAPFDVVIMDLTVPGGMGGQEAITHLQVIDPKVTAIVSSGYANDPIMSDYQNFGFRGVVTKPYKYNELNEVLNRLAERK